MKKKKEFFRIRKDRKRKNGANARACVYVYIDRTARDRLPFFQITTNDREKPLTVFFIPNDVLFSKHNRPCFVF